MNRSSTILIAVTMLIVVACTGNVSVPTTTGASAATSMPTTTAGGGEQPAPSAPPTSTVLLTGRIEVDIPAIVRWGSAEPGCSLIGPWSAVIHEGARIEVRHGSAALIGEGRLGQGETKANLFCHFPFEVEVPDDAEWYGVCVEGLGPFGPLTNADLADWDWTVVASVPFDEDPPEDPLPCDFFLGDDLTVRDDDPQPPPDPAVVRAAMRSAWEQLALDGYSIRWTRGQPGLTDRIPGDGRYSVAVEHGTVTRCVFTAFGDANTDPCTMLTGSTWSPVDHFYDLIDAYPSEHLRVDFDSELPIPVLIVYDDPAMSDEEFTIRVTDFRGNWP